MANVGSGSPDIAAESDEKLLEELRERVAAALGRVDGVVALRRTEEGVAPHLYHAGDDLSGLTLTPRYELASVVLLLLRHTPDARLGVVARGCDLRALVEMGKRQQVQPGHIYVIGVACSAEQAVECRCSEPAPDVAVWPEAELVGDPVAGVQADITLAEYRAMPLDQRRRFWQKQFSKCIKCYGCRNICPECFCTKCVLEDNLWVERGVLAPRFPMFHMIRAMHMSGRCIGCRQCELACPMGLPLTHLYDLLREDMANLFSYEPGHDLAQLPPMPMNLTDAPMKPTKKGG